MKPTAETPGLTARLDGPDPAELGRLEASVRQLLPDLEGFLRFDAPDISVTDREAWIAALDRPLPDEPAGLETVLDELGSWLVPHGQRTPHPGFMAYIIGRATTAGLAAGIAAQTAGHFRYFLTSFNFVEELSLRWLAELCGIPITHYGVYSSGGSTANLLAMGAARQAAFEAIGVDVGAAGLPDGVRARIYGGTEVHHTIQRAAGVMGLGRHAFTAVESDPAGRVDPAALDRRLRADRAEGILPIAVVAVAGMTSTGAVDPIDRIADVVADHGVWLHVDGAYGLPAARLPELADRFRGVERADSAIVDPHKWLGTPAGCGATYVRDGSLLERAFTQEPAPYLEAFSPADARSQFDSQGDHSYDRSLELSAPARGVWVWAVLREIGVRGMHDRVRRHVGLARHIADRAEEHERLELLLEPELSICCFRYRPRSVDGEKLDALNAEIVQLLRAEHELVPSTARIGGRLAIRPCIVNPATTLREADALVDAVVDIGDRLSA